MTTNTAARIVDVHPTTIKRHCREGRLNPSLTDGGHRRISPSNLAEYLHDHHPQHPLHSVGNELEIFLEGLRAHCEQNDDDMLIDVLFKTILNGCEPSFQCMVDHLFAVYADDVLVYGAILMRLLCELEHRYLAGQVGIADEHRITQAIKDACARHYLEDLKSRTLCGRQALIGCAQGDQHDISALLTRMIFVRRGYSVRFLGANVPHAVFRSEQERWGADVVCVSRTLPSGSEQDMDLIRTLSHHRTDEKAFQLVLRGSWSAWSKSWAARQTNIVVVETMRALDRWLVSHEECLGAKMMAS